MASVTQNGHKLYLEANKLDVNLVPNICMNPTQIFPSIFIDYFDDTDTFFRLRTYQIFEFLNFKTKCAS